MGRPPAAAGGQARVPSGAERRLVTVLFADLVGFTPFAEERDAEAVRDLLSSYFDLTRGIIERYGGTVEKFIGDAVMAVWGTPVAHEDDVERAVRAGLDLVGAVGTLGPGIEARAGILTGEAAVTLGASGQGMVAGDLVNTAARLQSVAPAGAVLVGEATMRAASDAVAFEQAGEQALKGKAAPVPAWRAVRVVAQRRGQGRSDMPEPPFVGRDAEMRTLRDLIELTGHDRRARLVSISGPGGIGKSRLAWELEKYIDGIVETIYWHRGRSPSYGDGITFWALGEMVRRRARLAEDDDEATTRERIRDAVAEFVPDEVDRRWVEPALLALLGLESPPAGGREALFAAWRMFFERIAARGTTILLFEDLQWADGGLLDFIDHLVEWSKGVQILVVTLARPELFDRRPDWGTHTRNYTSLALEPLSPAAMRALLEGYVPGLPASAIKAIVDRAEGMPLYAVETVRSLLAEGRLERVDGAYRPTGDLGEIAIPDTLRSLIASRLDALEPDDRSVLQDAAVLGQTFTLGALAAVSGGPADQLAPRLRALVRRELLELEEDPRSPERGQYGFVQSLIREVAYGTLARRDRRARHLAAARHFESLGEDELAGALAAHYLAARDASDDGPEADAIAIQARLALGAAAERSASLGAHAQAIIQLRQALEVASDPADRVDLLTRAARSAEAAGAFPEAEALAREASALAFERGDATAAGHAQAILGTIHINSGQTSQAVAVLEAAVAALPDTEVGEGRAEILASLARAYMRNGQDPHALEAADAALAIAERLELDRILAEAFNNKAAAYAGMGRRQESIALMQAAVDIAHAGGHIQAELRARANIASVVSAEDPRRAHASTLAALELARRIGHRSMTSWALSFHGWWSLVLGLDLDAALRAMEEEIEPGIDAINEARLLGVMTLIRQSRGEPVDDIFARRDALIAGATDPGLPALTDWLRGNRALFAGDYAAASDLYLRGGVPGLVYALGLAARAALWGRDIERLRVAVGRLDTEPEVLIDARVIRMAARAGLAALDGRTADAVAGYREAIRRAHDSGQAFEEALVGLDFLIAVGPEEPEARHAAEAARQHFERQRARPYLEKLEAALARAPAGDRAPAALIPR